MDEARIAAEQIVIPRQQAIELLPRTQQLLDIQVTAGLAKMSARSINAVRPSQQEPLARL